MCWNSVILYKAERMKSSQHAVVHVCVFDTESVPGGESESKQRDYKAMQEVTFPKVSFILRKSNS